MLTSPLRISVAIAAYNGERFLGEQLESLANQTRLPDELIVSDDRSTDRTVDIVRCFAARAPFSVRVLPNDRNLGVNRNFDRAVAACTGDVVFLCDQDDVWLPHKVAEMSALLARHDKVGLVISNSEMVDAALRPTGRRLYALKYPKVESLYACGEAAVRFILDTQTLAGHTMAFRRTPSLAKPTEEIVIGCTYDFVRAVVAGSLYDLAVVPDSLTKYRRYNGQVSSPDNLPPTRTEQFRRRLRRVFVEYNRTAVKRAEFSRSLRQICRTLEEFGADRELLRFLEGKAEIAAFQAGLESSRVERLAPVVANLLSGRYHKYANGLPTAVRDLVIPPSSRSMR